MPIEYDVDAGTGTVLARGFGVVAAKDIKETIAQYVDDTRLSVPHRELFDMTDVETFELDAGGVREVADAVRRIGDRFKDGKVAYVAEKNLVFGMGRMFEVFAENVGIELQAFRDIDEARRWLGLPGKSTIE